MVNFAACRIEMKSFYTIKAMEGQSEYFHEDLLKFTDFSSYLPLFWELIIQSIWTTFG